MAKQSTLQVRVAAAAKSVDRGDLADLIADKARALSARVEQAQPPRQVGAVESDLAKALMALEADQTRSSTTRIRRKARKINRWDQITPRINNVRYSGLRSGSKRCMKLLFVLRQAEEFGDSPLRVRNVLGKVYDNTTGETLTNHDLNGMVERGHISIGDKQ